MWQALFGGRRAEDVSNDEAVARALQASLDDETRRRRRGDADAFIDLTGSENDRRRSVVDLRSPEKKKRRPALADITRSAPRPARPAPAPQRRAVSDPRHGRRAPARSPPAPRSLARLMRGDGAATPPRSPPPRSPPPRPAAPPQATPVARTVSTSAQKLINALLHSLISTQVDVRRFVEEGFVVIRGAVDPCVEISQ